jgi:hypothetical protein
MLQKLFDPSPTIQLPRRVVQDGWWLVPATPPAGGPEPASAPHPLPRKARQPLPIPLISARGTSANPWLIRKCAAVILCTGLADWLLWNGGGDLAFVLFLAGTGFAASMVNIVRADRLWRGVAVGVLCLGMAPEVFDPGWFPFLFALIGLALFAFILSAGRIGSLSATTRWIVALPVLGPFRLTWDAWRVFRAGQRRRSRSKASVNLVAWIVPLAVGAVFAALFASANPLIERLLRMIDLRSLLEHLNIPRMLFWMVVICAVWPLLHIRTRRRFRRTIVIGPKSPPVLEDFDALFGQTAILRSLVLFNLLFSAQTVMDLAYLWGGVALPEGMTHAAYAHRGAWPLIFTALLAAAFVVVAMRRGGPAETSRLIEPLVLIWIGQNVVLVLSAILRLDLYVAAYSLTWLRVAAFIWMGLVGCGLMLIVARIRLRRSNGWLLRMNAAALAVTLYTCCFINFPDLIARYNLAANLVGEGARRMDVSYIEGLGANAIPAVDDFLRAANPHAREVHAVARLRGRMIVAHRAEASNWRSWNVRAWRLERYLANEGGMIAASLSRTER